MRYIILILIMLIPMGTACNNTNNNPGDEKTDVAVEKPKELAVRLVNLDAPADGAKFASGDNVDVEISLKGQTSPDSVRIYFDGEHITTITGEQMDYSFNTASARLGSVPVKIIAYSADKRPQTITHFIIILSDIIPPVLSYSIVNTFPHDKQAYTQGLIYHDGYFLESTGQEGKSSLRKVEIETGKVLKKHKLENKFFGEGIVLLNNLIYQLTWEDNVGFVYDLESFTELKRIHYSSQGWGLATNGEKIILSDGTNKIYFIEPEYFTVSSSIEVYDNEKAIWQLNELEYINGEIWANIYTTNRIARIDPESGKILAYINLEGLLSEREYANVNELNGIAWDSIDERLFVTGKNWRKLFEIKLRNR